MGNQVFYKLDVKALKQLKDAVDSGEINCTSIICGEEEAPNMKPLSWMVVYTNEGGWIDDISDCNFSINSKTININASFSMIVIRKDNYAHEIKICNKFIPTDEELQEEKNMQKPRFDNYFERHILPRHQSLTKQ